MITYEKAHELALKVNFTYDSLTERVLIPLIDFGFVIGLKDQGLKIPKQLTENVPFLMGVIYAFANFHTGKIIGGWIDSSGYYLDCCVMREFKADALACAIDNDQHAIYSLRGDEVFFVEKAA